MNIKRNKIEGSENWWDYRLVYFNDCVSFCRVVFSPEDKILNFEPVLLGNFKNALSLVSELEDMIRAIRKRPVIKMNCDSNKYDDSFYEQYKNIVSPDFFEAYFDWFQRQVSLCCDCFKK